MKIITSKVVKAVLLIACAALSGCALAGLEGPERQAKAKEALHNLQNQLANQNSGSGYYAPATSSRYSDVEDQLDDIQRQNEQIESDLHDLKEQQEEQESVRAYEKALGQ
jgi:hypothetical protein